MVACTMLAFLLIAMHTKDQGISGVQGWVLGCIDIARGGRSQNRQGLGGGEVGAQAGKLMDKVELQLFFFIPKNGRKHVDPLIIICI